MHRTNTSTVRSVVSKLQMPLCNAVALCGTLVRLHRSFKQRTKVAFPYFPKKRIPYFLAKIESFSVPYLLTYVPYRSAMLAGLHPYLQVKSETDLKRLGLNFLNDLARGGEAP